MEKPLIRADIESGGRLKLLIKTAGDEYEDIDAGETVKGLSVSGRVVGAGVPATFKITNYHFCDTYKVRTNNGTVSISGDTVTYTAAVGGAGGFWVNGSFVAVTVVADQPFKPSITYPANNQTGILKTATMLSSAFSAPAGTWTHVRSRWQIARDQYFGDIVLDTESPTALVSFVANGLVSKTSYYVRVKHIGSKA